VIAAEQHACRLVVPASQRMPATRWSSHKDHAAKALRKLAGPHLPASFTKLEQAVKRAHAAYEHAETGTRHKPAPTPAVALPDPCRSSRPGCRCRRRLRKAAKSLPR
jgi:hypothetical protein